MKGLTPVCDEDLQNSPFNVQIYNSEVIVHVVFQVSPWCCLFFYPPNEFVVSSGTSQPKTSSLSSLAYIFYPESHEIDLWQV